MIDPLAPVLNWFIYMYSIMPLAIRNLVGLALGLLMVSAIFSLFMRIH